MQNSIEDHKKHFRCYSNNWLKRLLESNERHVHTNTYAALFAYSANGHVICWRTKKAAKYLVSFVGLPTFVAMDEPYFDRLVEQIDAEASARPTYVV